MSAWKIVAGPIIFVKALEYCQFHKDTFGDYTYGLPPKVDVDKAKIDCSFQKWMNDHGLDALRPFFIYSQARVQPQCRSGSSPADVDSIIGLVVPAGNDQSLLAAHPSMSHVHWLHCDNSMFGQTCNVTPCECYEAGQDVPILCYEAIQSVPRQQMWHVSCLPPAGWHCC
jgi:hypothetical protein